MPESYEVIVDNVGIVYNGYDRDQAERCYHDYCKAAQAPYGQASGSCVHFIVDEEVTACFIPGD